jgi:hypothetical protein
MGKERGRGLFRDVIFEIYEKIRIKYSEIS